ncbi:MAG: DUF4271 domain-containing protein [Bacteroidales bacterium]|jgi:hypothetical protein|nr:DUF4271 domain-containing protein [Bacteroidales bacterium]
MIEDSLAIEKTDSAINSFENYIVDTFYEENNSIIFRPTLFKHKTYIDRNMNIIPKEKPQTQGWVYGIFIFVALLYCLIIRFINRRVEYLIKGKLNHTITFLVSIFCFCPLFALLLYGFITQYNYIDLFVIKSHFLIFIILYISTILYCILKYILFFFFGIVFRSSKICFKYNSIILGSYFFYGLVIFIPILLFYYLPENYKTTMLIITGGILIIFFLIRLIRCMKMVLQNTKWSKFYLFVYLCIVEFIPFIVVLKMLNS